MTDKNNRLHGFIKILGPKFMDIIGLANSGLHALLILSVRHLVFIDPVSFQANVMGNLIAAPVRITLFFHAIVVPHNEIARGNNRLPVSARFGVRVPAEIQD